MFAGDNRGFSLSPSNTGRITSRIWHELELNTQVGELTKVTQSDSSQAPWSEHVENYEGDLSPRDELVNFRKIQPTPHTKLFSITARYWGVNHAMPLSPELQHRLGVSYVPKLDVKYQITMEIDRKNKHIDLVTYVTGDGFPNCEAFIVDPSGQAIFLGVHVRKGAAPITLAVNLDYPMIASAIRIPIDVHGNFKGTVGDELKRRSNRQSEITFTTIRDWNATFLSMNPNDRRCMALERASLEGCFGR